MKPILKTNRLKLYEFSPDDANHLLQLNNDPEVIRYTGDPRFKDLRAAQDFISSYDQYAKHGMGRWTVRRNDTLEFLGWCGLKRHAGGEVDLGFRFLRAHWGVGYATEASIGCLKYGFEDLGLESIIARVMHENLASIRVIEKLHMTYVGDTICESHLAKKYLLEKKKFTNE